MKDDLQNTPLWNRRDLCLDLGIAAGVMAALGGAALGGGTAEAQTPPGTPAGDAELAQSRVIRFDQMRVSQSANGGWGRPVMHGTLPTGEFVEVHETMLPPGKMPHPPHRHRNTEFVLIREGKIEFYNNGRPEPAGPGDVIYTASNQLHGMKNVGDVPALYFVVSVSQK
jgi:quercetin dioxygenase-like cupin family protein